MQRTEPSEGFRRRIPGKHWPACVSSGEQRNFPLCCPSSLLKSNEGERFQGPTHQPGCWISPRIFNYRRKMEHTRGFSPWKELHPVLIRDGNFWGILDFFNRSQQFSCNKKWKSWSCAFHPRHKHWLTLWRDKVCKENPSDFHPLEKFHSKNIW